MPSSVTVDSPAACAALGGTVVNQFYGMDQIPGTNMSVMSRTKVLYVCAIPDKTASAPVANITVSPQISPVFQQQYQPQNSPATAGTTQTQAPVTTVSSQLPPAPAPSYSVPAPAPSYNAPSYPTYSAAPAQAPMPEQLPLSPLPSQTPPISAPMVSTAVPVQAGFDWKIGAVLAAGLFGIMALSGKKGK